MQRHVLGGAGMQGAGRADLGGEARALPGALSDAALDDARLRDQHVHQIAARHQVKQEVQVQLVLRTAGTRLLLMLSCFFLSMSMVCSLRCKGKTDGVLRQVRSSARHIVSCRGYSIQAILRAVWNLSDECVD